MLNRTLFFLLSLLIFNTMAAQEDPVLLKVGNTEVRLSEFEYIYNKTNGENATYSEKSLREYLNLYSIFKMKVQKARDLKLDTIPTLINELEGYRRQLSRNYLSDREIMERLTKEGYERMQKDVNISHILVKVPLNASPSDTLVAYKKILDIQKELLTGKRFAVVAKERSEDNSTKEKGGNIGFITALQLTNFYAIENAAYHTPVGEVSQPVRTRLGYHLIRVDEVRPARGEVEVGHILIRVNNKAEEEAQAQATINKLYRELQNGANFEELAKFSSQDEATASKGGYIGYFGIGRYEPIFEEAAFEIPNDGGYSRPFRSSVGWHVIKRISHRGIEPYLDVKGRLQNLIRRDSRFDMIQTSLINRIKMESGYMEVAATKNSFMDGLDATFTTYQWEPPVEGLGQPLFSLGGQTYPLSDFVNYLKKISGLRTREGRSGTPKEVAEELFQSYLTQVCMEYEEGRLEEKYPDFKALMREYREGILLFEVTKRQVWDKASQDSVGLSGYYERNKTKYKWEERVEATIYTLNTDSEKITKSFQKVARKKSPEQVKAKINKGGEFVSYETGIFEKGKNPMVDATTWKDGMLSSEKSENSARQFVKIEKVIKPQVKTLYEARGYVVADYQDYLEMTWVENLKTTYKVNVNEDVFKKMIRQ